MTFQIITRIVLLHAAVVLLAGDVSSSSAQSLGDVARREAERREQVSSGKVYTNGDLAPVDAAAAPGPQTPVEPAPGVKPSEPPPATSPVPPGDSSGKEPVLIKGREKRDEQYWRTQIQAVRVKVQKANVEVRAQETRLAELDGGPQTPTSLREREVVAASLVRAQRDARFIGEELTRWVTRAQMAKVPEESIR